MSNGPSAHTRPPAEDGFRMPAEWAPHARCWMAWACNDEVFSDLAAARAAYAGVARAIARFEPVTMVANRADLEGARALSGKTVETIHHPTDNAWMRDHGPTFVVDPGGRIAGINWGFNGWGKNTDDFAQDAVLPARILERLALPFYRAPFVLEGGSIHTDGEGTLLVTESCLLNPNRNPRLDRAEIETNLGRWLGVRKVIWLGDGLEDDETDGHVDNLACFARPGLVLALTTDDPADGNFLALQDNLERLRKATDTAGRTLEVVEIVQPDRRDGHAGRLALSYVNFYIANGGIVMPAFDAPEDEAAFEIVRRAFPERTVVAVNANGIVQGGGGIHCITQQQPAPARA